MRGNLLILPVNIVKGKAALFDIFFHLSAALFVQWHFAAAVLLFVNYTDDDKRWEVARQEVWSFLSIVHVDLQ